MNPWDGRIPCGARGAVCRTGRRDFMRAKSSGLPDRASKNHFEPVSPPRAEPPEASWMYGRSITCLRVDPDRMIADVEGMTTYETLVDETLRYGLLPAVVPQLKTITVGGAVSGLGIESSSFKYGLVHETVDEMEILTGEGSHRDLLSLQEPRSFLRISELLRHARLCAASHAPTGSSQALRSAHYSGFSEPAAFLAHI